MGPKLTSLASQASSHLIARATSSLVSFLLFASLARRLTPPDAQICFFFLFTLGFGASTLRLFLQLAAGIDGAASSSKRLRNGYRGLRSVLFTLPIATPLIAVSLWINSKSWALAVAGACTVAVASIDIDIVRGAVRRGPLFTWAFAAGSLLSFAGIYTQPHLTTTTALFWLLGQWAPVCLCNFFNFKRTVRFFDGAGGRVAAPTTSRSHRLSLLALAIYDGIILNTPFLGVISFSPLAALDLSLAMRIFVASLVMQPLLLHWANSPSLLSLARQLRLAPAATFAASLALTGAAIGVVFAVLYAAVARKPATPTSAAIFACLLMSYSVYASQMRLRAVALTSKQQLVSVAAPLAAFGFLTLSFREFTSNHALAMVAFQCCALLGAAALIRFTALREGTGRRK